MGLFFTKARTVRALGLQNILRVLSYRVSVWIGLNPVRRLSLNLPAGPFYRQTELSYDLIPSAEWRSNAHYFGWSAVTWVGAYPDWMANPLAGTRVEDSDRSWWQIPDFSPAVGDIKTVWEASRFNWVLAMAQRVGCGEITELDRLNSWLENWCRSNPAYLGPNWKCGQEASIRVMHMAMAAYILGQQRDPLPALLKLVKAHLARVVPTLRYAIAQDNNHGTSEAAALFIGGSWLNAATNDEDGKEWVRLGRNMLEERVHRLVERDGSFSQYSVNYHRMFLDTLSMVEVWRQTMDLPPFSEGLMQRVRAAALWLRAFTDSGTGDAPNIGANDGARLLPLTDTNYRDFRPSVHLGCVLFAKARAYVESGSWELPLKWLRLPIPDSVLPNEQSRLFNQGGYFVLQSRYVRVYMRFPRFQFRPSHADALHVDVWWNAQNILRDGGSYSYNADVEWMSYFPGVSSHNTIQFDGRDQMPRLGRFLFGDWLNANRVSDVFEEQGEVTAAAGYKDRQGVSQFRSLRLAKNILRIEDEVCGFKHKALLRWRLFPGSWKIDGDTIQFERVTLRVTASVPIKRMELVEGWESRYYMKKEAIFVLEVEILTPGLFKTELTWRD